MKGKRKLYVFTVSVAALLGGLALCALANVGTAYGAFAAGIGTVTGAAMLGNVGEHFASRGQP